MESNVQERDNTSQVNEFGNFNSENGIPRQERLIESMEAFTNEINLRLSQEMDSMMSMMHTQNNRAINSAISGRVIPEIQNIRRSISSGNRYTESSSSSNNQENNSGTNRLKTKIAKKDCRSVFDLRDTEDLSPYTCMENISPICEDNYKGNKKVVSTFSRKAVISSNVIEMVVRVDDHKRQFLQSGVFDSSR